MNLIVALNSNMQVQMDISKDFDALVKCLQNVEFATDPYEQKYKQALEENPAVQNEDPRTNRVTFSEFARRIITFARNVVNTRPQKGEQTGPSIDNLLFTLRIIHRCITMIIDDVNEIESNVTELNPDDLKLAAAELTERQDQLCT